MKQLLERTIPVDDMFGISIVIRKGRAFDLNGLEFGAIQNSEFAINSIREELIS